MKQKQLVLAISSILGMAGMADVFALSDSTNIGDSWKGWNLSEPDATEQGIENDTAWLYPSITIQQVVDDNYYNIGDDGVTATMVMVTPRIRAEFEGDTTVFRGSAQMTYAYNFHDSNDSNWGASLVGEMGWNPTEKLALWGGVGWQPGYEARGTGLAEWTGEPVEGGGVVLAGGNASNIFQDLVEWHEWSVRVGGDYGSGGEGAPTLGFEAARVEKTYQNYREVTSGRDSEIDQVGAHFSYWVQPNTAVNASARYFKFSYADHEFDSTQWRALLGMQWDVTYQTQGYAKLGWGEKDMVSPAVPDGSAMNWEVGVRWKPTPRANFVFSASRDFVEEDYVGYGDVMEYRLAWKHQWESYFGSSLIYNVGTESYPEYGDGRADDNREDDFWDLEFRLNYKARPWLTLDAGIRHSERESNLDQTLAVDGVSTFDYKENVLTLGVDMTFY